MYVCMYVCMYNNNNKLIKHPECRSDDIERKAVFNRPPYHAPQPRDYSFVQPVNERKYKRKPWHVD